MRVCIYIYIPVDAMLLQGSTELGSTAMAALLGGPWDLVSILKVQYSKFGGSGSRSYTLNGFNFETKDLTLGTWTFWCA